MDMEKNDLDNHLSSLNKTIDKVIFKIGCMRNMLYQYKLRLHEDLKTKNENERNKILLKIREINSFIK